MASLFKDPNKLSAYRDRRFPGTQEEYEAALQASTTAYIGNMSFYTTEEQAYELFSRAGEIKKIIMGLDKNSKTPCGFCFVLYYSREDAEDAVKYISGTMLDDRPIRVDFDWGFEQGRQWGRGRSGGQVRDEYRTDYDPGRGGYGKLVQKELQRELVDYGGSFQPNAPPPYERGERKRGYGDRNDRGDYQRKRYRNDDHSAAEGSRRAPDSDSPEKNPRFREKGDSDEEDDDYDKRPVVEPEEHANVLKLLQKCQLSAVCRFTCMPCGYGYIEYKKKADAEKALLYMNGGQIDGNIVRLRFTLQPRPRPSSPIKAPPPPPKRDAPQNDKGASIVEKEQHLREPSPRRKPASPPRKRSPNRRLESPRHPTDPSPRRRPDSPPVRRRAGPSPVRRGDTPPRRRLLSPVRRRSPSPPPRRHRSPMRPPLRRGRGSPSPRRRSPGPLRRRSPPPRRLRSPPPRRPSPPRRYSRSPPRRPLHSRSRSISPRSRRGRGPPLRRGSSDSSHSHSPSPPPRKGPRRVSRSRSPRRPPRGRNISSDSRSSSSPSPRRR